MLLGMLLAFDLDKTILTEDYLLPSEIRHAITGARRSSHQVAVLTGRPQTAIVEYLEQLEMVGPFSVNNGAMVVGPQGEVLRRLRLDAAQTGALIEPLLDDAITTFSCMVDDTLYVRDPEHERWAWAQSANRRLGRYRPSLQLEADKVIFVGVDAGFAQKIRHRHPQLDTYLWGDGYLEILPGGADKGAALELITETLGLSQHETIAFGDGVNDVSMIGWAGHGVAVGPDAHPQVLALAQEHITAPEDGGVARWIEENLG